MRNTLAALAAAAGAACAVPPAAAEPTTGYAEANGVNVYYERTGTGPPAVVLHGAYMSTAAMAPLTAALAEDREVIAFDLQGHGRTGDVDRPISYEAMADDVAAAMTAIGVEQADVFGYSMGGGGAYQLAIRHPEKVRRLAAASAGFRTDAMYPELVEMIGAMTPDTFAGTPWEAEYKAVAPEPDNFPVLVEKLIALDTEPMAWPEADIRGIAAPTLVISGDADVIRPEHSVEIWRLHGGGPSADFMTAPTEAELAILPGTTHLGVMEKPELIAALVDGFFDEPDAGATQ